jgi:glycine/D-amino acid oxidase-like deaminating enzyme
MLKGATEERDLRTGTTIWEVGRAPRLRVSQLTRSIAADVVVVGAGISGALIAERLAASGLRVAIVDRRGACRGSTAASTALIQFEIDSPLAKLTEKIGSARATRVWSRSAASVHALIVHTQQLGIRCQLARRTSLYLAGAVLGARELRREADLRGAIGLPSRFIDRESLLRRVGIDRPGAILSHGNAEADPVRLAAGFLRRALRLGAQLFSPVDVVRVRSLANGVEADTSDDFRLQCRFLVYATGYEPPGDLAAGDYRIASTWAIATKPQPENLWPTRDLVWEASDPYLYLRTTAEGRVIAGGEDESFEDDAKRDRLIPAKSARIEAKLGALMPAMSAPTEFRWAGCFGTTETGLPKIGEVPGLPRCYAALGYGGNGITFSLVAAQLIQRQICGARDPDADLFAFA